MAEALTSLMSEYTVHLHLHTHTHTYAQCSRTGELGLDEVSKEQGFACVAANENPPCSCFAC